MNPLLSYFWPIFEAALLIGVVATWIGVNHARRGLVIAIGAAAAIALAGLWHGPGGAADRFAGKVDRMARESLDYYEMTALTGELHRAPLTRRLVLSGPADDFQHAELVRLFSQLPGVSGATWDKNSAGLPLIAEGILAALAGFLVGALLAYLLELRRRYNAQWRW